MSTHPTYGNDHHGRQKVVQQIISCVHDTKLVKSKELTKNSRERTHLPLQHDGEAKRAVVPSERTCEREL